MIRGLPKSLAEEAIAHGALSLCSLGAVFAASGCARPAFDGAGVEHAEMSC
jgi:hypothetical protein